MAKCSIKPLQDIPRKCGIVQNGKIIAPPHGKVGRARDFGSLLKIWGRWRKIANFIPTVMQAGGLQQWRGTRSYCNIAGTKASTTGTMRRAISCATRGRNLNMTTQAPSNTTAWCEHAGESEGSGCRQAPNRRWCTHMHRWQLRRCSS